MKRHILSEQDVVDIFARPFVVPLASCARAGRVQGRVTRKALEHHLSLDTSYNRYYLVTSTTDGIDEIEYRGDDRDEAIAAYNKIDV